MKGSRVFALTICVTALSACGNLGSFGGHTRVSIADGTEVPRLEHVEAHWRDFAVVLEGKIANPGLCPQLEGDDGRMHALVGSLRGVKPGERVRISGPTAIWSDCPLGSVIRADRIERIGATEQQVSQAPY